MREGEALFTPIKTDLYFLMRASFKKEVFENETFFPLKTFCQGHFCIHFVLSSWTSEEKSSSSICLAFSSFFHSFLSILNMSKANGA